MEEETINIEVLLAAAVASAGGSLEITFEAFESLKDGDKALALDPTEAGLRISLVPAEEVPNGE